MVVQGLPPGMQHRKETDVCAQIVRIAGHGQEGLSHGLKEEVVYHPRVLEREWAEGMRESKYHMDVGTSSSSTSRAASQAACALPGHFGQCRLPQEF